MNQDDASFMSIQDDWAATPHTSFLTVTDGKLSLRIVQAASGKKLVGTRLALQNATIEGNPSEDEITSCRELLSKIVPNTLTVISFHPGLRGCERELSELASTSTVVGLGGNMGNGTNSVYIATGHKLHRKPKLSLSTEDLAFNLTPGTELPVFGSNDEGIDSPIRWTVLNCHDYSHVDLLRAIQMAKVELIVVVTYNTATRLFWEYAIADMHRLFCFVVVVNVSELGGSGVFAPFRKIGEVENASLNLGGQIFGVKGPGCIDVTLTLQIHELRKLRQKFTKEGFNTGKSHKTQFGSYEAVMPPEQFLSSVDRAAGFPIISEVVEHPIEWNCSSPRVAIAQLDSMEIEAYKDTKYRIRNHEKCRAFEHMLNIRLLELEMRCRNKGPRNGPLLDLLVLPEVFIPRTYLRTLQGFSDRLGTLVIAGMDYPGESEQENANECAIIRPNTEPIFYRKISRSQYDAIGTDGNRMRMQRGTQLVRLIAQGKYGIGILICSDFSNFDLMWSLNLKDRVTPLDLVIVVAHNPFGSLYRSCCIADSHRYYQYILMCNVANYGGSGIYGPQRTRGARQVLAEIGQGVEAIAMADLPLEGLKKARSSDDNTLHSGNFMRRPGVFQSRWFGGQLNKKQGTDPARTSAAPPSSAPCSRQRENGRQALVGFSG